MKLQAAIDRVSIEEAVLISEKLCGIADIIEIGTSLIKEFGISASVSALKKRYPNQCFLADIKTCDEGEYEFRKIYEAGADIATVMGFSSETTIHACAQVARKFGKKYMIDLMEVPSERLKKLTKNFPDAVFGIHLPADLQGVGLEELIHTQTEMIGNDFCIAAAGGVKLENISIMKHSGIEIGIAGGSILKAKDIRAAACEFANAMHGQEEK